MQCSALKAVQWVQCSAGRRAPEGIKGPCRHQHTAFQHQRLQCLQCSDHTHTMNHCPAVAPNALQCSAVQWWCSATRHSGNAVNRLVRAVQGMDSMHSTPDAPLYCGSAVHCTVMHALQWVQCSAGCRAPEGINGPCRHKHTAFQHQRRQCQAVPAVRCAHSHLHWCSGGAVPLATQVIRHPDIRTLRHSGISSVSSVPSMSGI
jgi:hypothetical protein